MCTGDVAEKVDAESLARVLPELRSEAMRLRAVDAAAVPAASNPGGAAR